MYVLIPIRDPDHAFNDHADISAKYFWHHLVIIMIHATFLIHERACHGHLEIPSSVLCSAGLHSMLYVGIFRLRIPIDEISFFSYFQESDAPYILLEP